MCIPECRMAKFVFFLHCLARQMGAFSDEFGHLQARRNPQWKDIVHQAFGGGSCHKVEGKNYHLYTVHRRSRLPSGTLSISLFFSFFRFEQIFFQKNFSFFPKCVCQSAYVKVRMSKRVFVSLQDYLPTLLPEVAKGEDPEFPPTLRIDGSTSSQERERLINLFNDDAHRTQIFIISTEAGGIGINLTGACRVVLMVRHDGSCFLFKPRFLRWIRSSQYFFLPITGCLMESQQRHSGEHFFPWQNFFFLFCSSNNDLLPNISSRQSVEFIDMDKRTFPACIGMFLLLFSFSSSSLTRKRCRSFDWLIEWSDRSIWSIDWLIGPLIDWLIGPLIDWLIGPLIDWLIDCCLWLIDWSGHGFSVSVRLVGAGSMERCVFDR